MWSMSWRARLRRFRLPRDEEESSSEERESGGGDSCDFGTPNIDVAMPAAPRGDECAQLGGNFLATFRTSQKR